MSKNRGLFELIILGFWLFIAIILTVDYNVKTSDFSLVLYPNDKIEVKKISVIDGSSFDVVLNNQSKNRVRISLPVTASKEAKQKVKELLSQVSNPKVFFYNKKRGGWSADLKFFIDGKETSLNDWLISNDLVKE